MRRIFTGSSTREHNHFEHCTFCVTLSTLSANLHHGCILLLRSGLVLTIPFSHRYFLCIISFSFL